MERVMVFKKTKFFYKARIFLQDSIKHYVFHDYRKLRQVYRLSSNGNTVLLIAPGEMAIPTEGWGAVEYIVSKQALFLHSQGWDVIVLNSWYHRDWFKVFVKRPDIVICHYDLLAKRAFFYSKLLSVPLIAITHFGYAAFPEKWKNGWDKYLKWISKSDLIIALSPSIYRSFSKFIPEKKLRLITNGADCKSMKQNPSPDRDFIWLGKIEPRKRQIEFALRLNKSLDVDFVGPINEEDLYSLPINLRSQFLGPWRRMDIENNLSRYRVLVLLSDGEADALVLHEAQAAGLSLIVSMESVGAQDLSLPWVHLFDEENVDSSWFSNVLQQNSKLRPKILEHARVHLDWDIKFSILDEEIRKFLA
jgi:hypothetical protein